MKIEYLLIKSKNDFCCSVEQFKSLLLTNKRISISADKLLFSKASFDYSISLQEIKGKKKEVVFYFSISSDTENDEIVSKLENFDKLLQRINVESGNMFKINTIWDDVSIYYAQKLYPQIVQVENLLRKIIYRFMIKTAGSTWFDNTVPSGVKESIEKTLKKNGLKLDETGEDQLYYADFVQLGVFLFEPYTLKPLSQEAIIRIKEAVDDEKKNLAEVLKEYTAKSNWERYFAEKIPVNELQFKWQKLYGYRNQVAHAKRIKKAEYDDASVIINELVKAFIACLENIDGIVMTEDESQAIKEVAKETVSPNRTVIRKTGSNEVVFTMPKSMDYAGVSVTKLGEAMADALRVAIPNTTVLEESLNQFGLSMKNSIECINRYSVPVSAVNAITSASELAVENIGIGLQAPLKTLADSAQYHVSGTAGQLGTVVTDDMIKEDKKQD